MTIMSLDTTLNIDKDKIFEKEFLPFADALYNFAYHLTGYSDSDADDLVQETFIKAYKSANLYQIGTNAKAWLFKILKNGFINDYRKKQRLPDQVDIENVIAYQDSEDETVSSYTDLNIDLFDKMIGDEVSTALNNLPTDFKTVILLCDVEGFSYEEISKILEIPLGTVRSRLHRGRNLLKEKLKDYANEYGYN